MMTLDYAERIADLHIKREVLSKRADLVRNNPRDFKLYNEAWMAVLHEIDKIESNFGV